jgi:amino acid permease
MNTSKLFFGNAYLSIPNTFKYTGWLGGLTLFTVVGPINCYTMLLNLKVADKHPEVKSYSGLGKKVFGLTGKIIVDISIWVM